VPLRLCGVLPASYRVDHIRRIAVAGGCGVLGDAAHRAAVTEDNYLGRGTGEACDLGRVLDVGVDRLVGEPETLLIDSTLLPVLHPRQVGQSVGFAGAAWVRWGSFCVYGVKLHLLCATNRVPISHELTPANVAEIGLVQELLDEANLANEPARKLLGDLAYRSERLKESLAEVGVLLATEQADRRCGRRQQVEIALSSLKRVFRLGETLATTLVGLATRIAAKMTAYTYAFMDNRMLCRPQGRIKELWA
jgi:hypothetical protein